MADRIEFSVRVRKAAWDRAQGRCECGCGRAFGKHPKERPEYHHRLAAYLGGEPTVENCLVVRWDCHRLLTDGQQPVFSKVRREEKRVTGTERKKAKIPGSKGTGWRKPLNGPAYRIDE